MKNIIKDTNTIFDLVLLGTDGKKVEGLDILYEIRRADDNSLTDTGIMGEESGRYFVIINLSVKAQYVIFYTTPAGYEDGMEEFIVIDEQAKEASVQSVSTKIDSVAGTLTTIINSLTTHRGLTEDKLARILGLVQENYRIIDPTYDSNGDLVSSIIRLYNSKADCNSNINPFATYSVVATYDVDHHLTSYKVTKE
jgi:hypothetical protein